MRGLPFRSGAFRHLLVKTSSLVIVTSSHCGCCLCGIAKSVAAIGLSKLDRAPMRAAFGASHHGPKSIGVRWRPLTTVGNVARGRVDNLENGGPPVPCSSSKPGGALGGLTTHELS